jgi:hypothetical protein
MATNTNLEWCIIRLGEDVNWWVTEISDEIRWDVDGLGVIDPRQFGHLLDLCEPLRQHGFDPELLDGVFFKFRIDMELKGGHVRLVRVTESLLDSDESLFALPDILDEEKGPYADFLDQVTKFRVKLLNDLIDFEHNLTIDELEEEIRERHNSDFIDGRSVHFFAEINDILEYVPDGFELDLEDEDLRTDDALTDIPEIEENDEKIVEDETMRWDEDEEEESGDDEGDDDENDKDEMVEEPKPKRGRPRKK